MGTASRNALKGYTYQQSVFVLFLSIMDTEHKITKITAEALDTKKFDDVYIECKSNEIEHAEKYRIQVKNYSNISVEDISITEHILSIKNNNNEFVPDDNNIVIVNTENIATTESFMGLSCMELNGITIIPLTPEQIVDIMDDMFCNESRELRIIHMANKFIENARFEISIDDLPDLNEMSIDLENDTVLLRKAPQNFEHIVTFIEGKPGVGKSHFVNEICENNPDAIIYRFWIGSQDPNRNERIRFEKFILELGILVYGLPKKVSVDEIVNKIEQEDKLIIIDGLDHVENYNPKQMEQFIDFIKKLKNTRTVVLSRPLKYEIPWQKEVLLDWTFDETSLYLEMAHEITEYRIQQQIFNISGGYPIITYFLAEDFKLNHRINIELPIKSINDYYDTLFLRNEKPSAAISIFASGNCFFTLKEIEGFFSEPEMYEVICEFIKNHPYLFKIIENRISLIHDSLNTYLRIRNKSFEQRRLKTIAVIRESLLKGSVEYMDRMESFEFDEEFYSAMLKKYANIDVFKELMLSTRDYNSITSLYEQLRRWLEDKTGVLNIYEYYSFCLLFQIANRNDLIGCDSFVYQMLLYMYFHEGIQDNIFSSDYIWQVYLVCKGKENYAEQYLKNKHIANCQLYDLFKQINEDYDFYNKKEQQIAYCELEEKLKNANLDSIKKRDALKNYLISAFIYGKVGDKYFDLLKSYLSGNKESSLLKFCNEMLKFGIEPFGVKIALNEVEYQLHELGFFGKKNKFRKSSLYDMIKQNAYEGSFTVMELAASYLKLANYEHRDVDIRSLAYCWSMYHNRKDYSVSTIEEALLAFEAEELLDWKQSFKIIDKLLGQSEKGISNLLTSYINKKGPDILSQIKNMEYFENEKNNIWFWDLTSANYACFSESEILAQVRYFLSQRSYSKEIEYDDIQEILKSKHYDLVLNEIKLLDYTISEPDKDLIPLLDEKGIKYIDVSTKEKIEYEPFNHNSISENDFEYISGQNIGYMEICQYADGWYSCLPFVEVFSFYPKQDIQRDYLMIIHKSMFAHVSGGEHIGSWQLLIGHIPQFLLQYEIDVDWEKIYDIFNKFLDISLICRF